MVADEVYPAGSERGGVAWTVHGGLPARLPARMPAVGESFITDLSFGHGSAYRVVHTSASSGLADVEIWLG
jgi:hypothetical protein